MVTIKDPLKLIRILNTLRPMAARLLLFLVLTKKPNEPFNYTLYEMSHDANVKNIQRSISDIIKKGYITRESSDKGSYSYTINIDL